MITDKDLKSNIPEGVSGAWRVLKFTLTSEELRFDFSSMKHGRQAVPGDYTKLMRGSSIIMSDTPAEIRDLYPLKWSARGNVLIHGLGLGCAVELALRTPVVNSVTVVEQSADVIELVAPTLQRKYGERLTIVQADAYEWKPQGLKFDAIWSDIWDDICSDNLVGMKRLRGMWMRRTQWHGFWCKPECMRAKRRDDSFMSFKKFIKAR